MSETQARCSMCCIECPVAVNETASGRRWEPQYPPRDDGLRGLCARGNLLGELVGLPQRLRRAALGASGKRRWCKPAVAVAALADALKSASRAAIIADGRLPWEDLAALSALAGAVDGAVFSVYVPAEDAQLVRGLAFAGAKFARPEAMAEADALLLVGDVFAACPVAAGPILAAKRARRRVPIVQIDSADAITGRFAGHALQIAAGTEHLAVAALAGAKKAPLSKLLSATAAGALAAGCGVDAAALAAAAADLAAAKKIAVAVAPCPGRTGRWDIVGLAAAQIAGKTGCVVPCTAYRANAFLAAAALGAAPVESVLDGTCDCLVLLGCDPATAMGSLWAKAAASGPALAAIAAMPGVSSDAAEVLLPMPMIEETAGTLLQWEGGSNAVAALLDPPAGATAVRETAAAVAAALGSSLAAAAVPKNVSPSAPESLEPVDVQPANGDALLLAMRPDASAFDDGSLTGLTPWAQASRPAPVLQLSAEDARRLALVDGDVVEVTSEQGRCRAAVFVEARQRVGVAMMSAAFAAGRGLFAFEPVASATAVTVQKKDV